jgi:hypothetical protein
MADAVAVVDLAVFRDAAGWTRLRWAVAVTEYAIRFLARLVWELMQHVLDRITNSASANFLRYCGYALRLD